MTDRMALAALSDRLIYADEKTFAAQDATDILALLPKPSGWRRLLAFVPHIRARGTMPSLGGSGVAAGVGSVSLPGERKSFDLDTHGRVCIRAGQWRLYRNGAVLWPGRDEVRIEQAAGDERIAALIYRRGQPIQMVLWTPHIAGFFGVAVGVSIPSPWKVPA